MLTNIKGGVGFYISLDFKCALKVSLMGFKCCYDKIRNVLRTRIVNAVWWG